MSESLRPGDSDDGARDPIEALLRSAGPGIVPNPARMERAMRVVHGEWHAVLASRRRARRLWLVAACASIAVLGGLVVGLWPSTAVPVATAARVKGDVLVRHVERGEVGVDSVTMGRVVTSGEEIETGSAGRVLLVLASGARVRIDTLSLVQWVSPTELRVIRGTVYAETSESHGQEPAPLLVSTPLGVARHVGTRFEVRVSDGEARVRVREGTVSFERKGSPTVTIGTGQQLSVGESRSILGAGPGSADAQWEWTREISPGFAIEGRSLFDALDWLSQETGLRVAYRDEQARSQARAITLRGSIEGLDTRDALRAVLAGSGLAFALSSGSVEIRVGRGTDDKQ
jgi:ferric-dicitrate binding protein FerR (iron transport regulator)